MIESAESAGGRARRWSLNWPAWQRLVVAASYFAALNWMLLAPAGAFEDLPALFPHEDKAVHVAVFLGLAWLARWAAPASLGLGARRFALPAALLLYAGAIETFQPHFGGAGRGFEWLDLAANLTGSGAGWLLCGRAAAKR